MLFFGNKRLANGAGAPPRGRAPDWPARYAELAQQVRDPRLRAFYEAGVPGAATPVRDAPLIAMDFETTGLDPTTDGIVSVGLVPMSLERIATSASRHWIVRPRVPLDEKSVTLHGITDSQVRDAPDLDEILDEVLRCMAGHVAIVHCSDIERQFLDKALKVRIDEGIVFPVIDTMELEARIYRTHKRGLVERLLGRKSQESIRLAASRARFGLPRYHPHHALTDALASAELLQAQIAHRFSPDTRLDELWS